MWGFSGGSVDVASPWSLTGRSRTWFIPRVPPPVPSQPVYLLVGLKFLLFLPPSAGSELCSLVSQGGVDDVGGVVVVVRDAVLLVGPLLGLDPLLEGDDDDLAGEDLDDASVWFCTPRFRLLDGDSVDRDGSLPTIVLRNPNPKTPKPQNPMSKIKRNSNLS